MVQGSQISQVVPQSEHQILQLSDVMTLCRKSCDTFLMATRYAETAAIRNLMSYYAQLREQFMDELNKMGRPMTGCELPPVSSEMYIHTSDLLKMCESVERELATAYEQLNYTNVPHESRGLIWQQYIEVRQCCHNLNTLYGVYRQL